MLKPESMYASEIDDEIAQVFLEYTSKERSYFNGTSYIDKSLNILYGAINNYYYLLSRKYFLLKKNLLIFQASLLEKNMVDHIDEKASSITAQETKEGFN
ncbi:hypothetical protein MM239_06280 [Belliella sp. DSM 111904]|uniref:Uncharacterized protein n=1 Tax=Belliella filtrata TaxID=2923435 RepID=A0ABS9UXV2_9BACT|nr:hypothetical protein [Belliella filtrata]MCH7408993.1 hypothetical protein [Belliella filtrata]